ncbi:MAG: hypothetical protein BroJett038_33160 [Chloroflexota bacterium]|nr:MAG: hypothetical protein BroJett038_33160 [Chloroflexota bacterium]
MPEAVLAIVLSPLLPILSEHYSALRKEQFSLTLSRALALSALTLVPFALILVSMPELALLPFGSGYKGNEIVVQIVMLQAVIAGMTIPFGSVLASMGRMWFALVYNGLYAFVLLLASIALVPRFGAIGLAISTAVTMLCTAFACVAYMYWKEPILVKRTPIAGAGISAIAIYGISFITYMHFGRETALGLTLVLIVVWSVYMILKCKLRK